MTRRLDTRVQFRRATMIDDGFASVPDMRDHGAPIWASKTDVSDAERMRSGEVQAAVMARFVIPSTPFTRALTPKDILRHDGRDYEITGIKAAYKRIGFLEITATRRNDG